MMGQARPGQVRGGHVRKKIWKYDKNRKFLVREK